MKVNDWDCSNKLTREMFRNDDKFLQSKSF